MTASSAAYEALAEELADAGVVPSLAELHGGICGVMCIGGVIAAERWLDQCLGDWQLHEKDHVGDSLRELEIDTWRMLSGEDLSFEPLLPGEDEPMERQVRGLALWCHGFLTGLGFGGLKRPEDGTEEGEALAEITRDFAEISRAALSDEDEQDLKQAGFALEELKEYVRVSVQLVFEQQGARPSDQASDSIH